MDSAALHRQGPGRRMMIALFDGGLVMVGICAALLWQAGSLDLVVPMTGTHGGSIAAGILLTNTANGLYASPTPRNGLPLLLRTLLALAAAMLLTYAVFTFLPPVIGQRGDVLTAAMLAVGAVVLRRGYVAHVAASGAGRRARTLVFGSGEAARVVGHTLTQADPDVLIVGYYPGPNEKHPAVPAEQILDGSRSLLETARALAVDEIVVALTERRAGSMPLRELLDCKLEGVKVCDLNAHFEKRLGQIRIDYVNASWLIFSDGFNQGLGRTVVKRLFDLVCAGALLLLAAPVMLLAALAIRLDSPGAVLYRQPRVGLNGRVFDVVKFRSMRADAEKDGQAVWATKNDNRVTRVGRFIRVTRIDELPQLLSVLKGDMSLVGPRPERPPFVEQLTREIPFYAVRHSVKPGVTGWAQVRYQYGSTVEDSQQKLQYDLHYVKNHSLWLDLQILVHTVHVVLTGKGAR